MCNMCAIFNDKMYNIQEVGIKSTIFLYVYTGTNQKTFSPIVIRRCDGLNRLEFYFRASLQHFHKFLVN